MDGKRPQETFETHGCSEDFLSWVAVQELNLNYHSNIVDNMVSEFWYLKLASLTASR